MIDRKAVDTYKALLQTVNDSLGQGYTGVPVLGSTGNSCHVRVLKKEGSKENLVATVILYSAPQGIDFTNPHVRYDDPRLKNEAVAIKALVTGLIRKTLGQYGVQNSRSVEVGILSGLESVASSAPAAPETQSLPEEDVTKYKALANAIKANPGKGRKAILAYVNRKEKVIKLSEFDQYITKLPEHLDPDAEKLIAEGAGRWKAYGIGAPGQKIKDLMTKPAAVAEVAAVVQPNPLYEALRQLLARGDQSREQIVEYLKQQKQPVSSRRIGHVLKAFERSLDPRYEKLRKGDDLYSLVHALAPESAVPEKPAVETISDDKKKLYETMRKALFASPGQTIDEFLATMKGLGVRLTSAKLRYAWNGFASHIDPKYEVAYTIGAGRSVRYVIHHPLQSLEDLAFSLSNIAGRSPAATLAARTYEPRKPYKAETTHKAHKKEDTAKILSAMRRAIKAKGDEGKQEIMGRMHKFGVDVPSTSFFYYVKQLPKALESKEKLKTSGKGTHLKYNIGRK